MAADGYVTIHRTTDAAQGELLAELLRREGIAAHFHKVSSALIGVPTSMIEMTVDVPAGSEARAKELLADLEYAGAAEALERGETEGEGAPEHDGDDDDGDHDDVVATDGPRGRARSAGARSLSNRRPVFAAAFAFFLPGGAHLYARRAWTALVMAVGVVACLAVIIGTRTALVFEFAFTILIALVVCDAVGGVRAARAEARGERRSTGRQLARGLGLLAAAIALGGGARLTTAAPRLWREYQLSKYRVTCTAKSIFVENRGAAARTVEIAQLKVAMRPRYAILATRSQLFDIGPAEPAFMDLVPGGRGSVAPEVPDWLAHGCGLSGPPEPKVGVALNGIADPSTLNLGGLFGEDSSKSCRFWFVFLAGDPQTSGVLPLRAVGSCQPPRPSAAEPNAGAAEGELILPHRPSFEGDADDAGE